MKWNKDESVKNEAQQWACELEFIGREVLAHSILQTSVSAKLGY